MPRPRSRPRLNHGGGSCRYTASGATFRRARAGARDTVEEVAAMWKIFLGIWIVSFVLLFFFYLESEMRWRSKDRIQRGGRGRP